MESMERLGFPTDDKTSPNYSASVHLLVNDNKINGSSKEGIRQIIATGGTWATGERVAESKAYPEKLQLSSHHIAMVVGDDLNDISQIFSAEDVDAVSRVELAIENMDSGARSGLCCPTLSTGVLSTTPRPTGSRICSGILTIQTKPRTRGISINKRFLIALVDPQRMLPGVHRS